MGIFYDICMGLTSGVMIGFLLAGIKQLLKKEYTEKERASNQRFINKIALALKYLTFLLLIIGLIWCVYFLILGALMPSKTDYANNMAELIESVLTVISIIFAFVEFLRRKED